MPTVYVNPCRKTGIYPLNIDIIPVGKLQPSLVTNPTPDATTNEVTDMETLLQRKLPKFVPPFKKPNQRKHGVAILGKVITEGDILQKLKEREQGPTRKLSFEEEKENHPSKSSKGGKNDGKGKKVGKGKHLIRLWTNRFRGIPNLGRHTLSRLRI